MSKCHIVGNHMSRLNYSLTFSFEVSIEGPVLSETSPTVFTLVGLLSCMYSFMTYHRTLLTETTVTEVTNIR